MRQSAARRRAAKPSISAPKAASITASTPRGSGAPRQCIASLLAQAAEKPVSSTTLDVQEVPERWKFTFDSRQWQLGYQGVTNRESIREYVLQRETVEAWSELVTSFFTFPRPMTHRTKTDPQDRPEPEPALTTHWHDEPYLDHHLEEMLAALSAVPRLRLQPSPDISA